MLEVYVFIWVLIMGICSGLVFGAMIFAIYAIFSEWYRSFTGDKKFDLIDSSHFKVLPFFDILWKYMYNYSFIRIMMMCVLYAVLGVVLSILISTFWILLILVIPFYHRSCNRKKKRKDVM